MKFQADAHISLEMVEMICHLGHECRGGWEIPLRLPDIEVLRRAAGEDRVVITADKDFGELVYVHQIPCPGVVLLRLSEVEEVDRVQRLSEACPLVLSRLPGSFITVTSTKVRVRPLR